MNHTIYNIPHLQNYAVRRWNGGSNVLRNLQEQDHIILQNAEINYFHWMI